MKKLKRYMVALTAAMLVALVMQQTVHAEGFYNCITIWWYQECYWVNTDVPDLNAIGFEQAYALCQFLGLCP